MATGLQVGVNIRAVTEHTEVVVVVVVVLVVLVLGSHIPMQSAEGASEAIKAQRGKKYITDTDCSCSVSFR
jgi:hypothetical protein